MRSIVSNIMWKMKKIFRAILEKSPKNTSFQHLIPYNPGLRIFRKNRYMSFEILWCATYMQKINKILIAVLEKYWSRTTN